MKLKIVVLALILTTGFNSLFAGDFVNVSRTALSNFQKEFVNAENIRWATAGPLTKATFNLNGHEYHAYYSERGERVAVARNIHVSNLPIKLMAEVKSDYKNYWITGAFEISKENEEAYYLTIENADERITLQSAGFDEWAVYKTSIKD